MELQSANRFQAPQLGQPPPMLAQQGPAPTAAGIPSSMSGPQAVSNQAAGVQPGMLNGQPPYQCKILTSIRVKEYRVQCAVSHAVV